MLLTPIFAPVAIMAGIDPGAPRCNYYTEYYNRLNHSALGCLCFRSRRGQPTGNCLIIQNNLASNGYRRAVANYFFPCASTVVPHLFWIRQCLHICSLIRPCRRFQAILLLTGSRWSRLPIADNGERLLPMSLASPSVRVFPRLCPVGYTRAVNECFVREGVYRALVAAAGRLPKDIGLIVLDGWRPWRVQQIYLEDATGGDWSS